MDSLQFDFTPFTINAVSLIIVGLASISYLARLRQKSTTTWLMALGLSSFTVTMVCMFLNGVILWGNAFGPLTDAFSVVSMAAMVEFAYRYPQNSTSPGSRLIRALAWSGGLAALGLSVTYAYRYLALRDFTSALPAAYGYLNPLTFLMALSVSVFRTVAIQTRRLSGARGILKAFIQPQDRPARLLRNFSLALSIGLVQGIVSGVGLPAVFPAALGPTLINLSLLLMLAALVYASFDFPAQQPSLVVRLVGLTLVTTMAVLGMIALYDSNWVDQWIMERTAAIVADSREALQAGHPENIPGEVLYVLDWPQSSQSASDGRLVTAREPGFDAQRLLQGAANTQAPPIWGYDLAKSYLMDAAAHGREVRIRNGVDPDGSYYQYAGFVVDLEGARYEVGIDVAELNRPSQSQGMGLVLGMVCSALVILFIFPLFFRSNLIRPLDRLLAGVRQVDAGELDVRVRVTHNDEVGFLTTAFNKMASSLKRELDGRQSAEADLRQLNLTLEARVTERTRALEALYDVTAASSQASDAQRLLTVLLERSLSALRAPLGFILLLEEHAGAQRVRLAASQALPPDWLPHLAALRAEDGWAAAIAGQPEPVLIADTRLDGRTPAFMRLPPPLALALAPLYAEGRALGIMGMARPAAERFDLDEVALLVSIVNQVGVAVHTETLRQRVQQASVLEERQRLARDLHDSVTQSLYGLVTLTEVGLIRVEAEDLRASAETYRKIGQSARQAIREMRLFIHQLRPPALEQEGLAGALSLRLAAVEGHSDVHTRLIADEELHLAAPVETALYHIAQEALNNALKHAHAANVTVTLARKGQSGALLEVVDDGSGFEPLTARGGMGLASMQARASEIGALFAIESQPGRGTRVSVCLEKTS